MLIAIAFFLGALLGVLLVALCFMAARQDE